MRPLEIYEYSQIMDLLDSGFQYRDHDNKKRVFRPNPKVKMALFLETNLGLRISDIKRLKIKNFKGSRLEITEKKTGKLQYREINPEIVDIVKDYAIENGLRLNDNLLDIGIRNVQQQLKIITNYLGLENISTHSFRKLYATLQYEKSNGNIELIKELQSHTSIATTQKYIRVSQQEIDKASREFLLK